MNDNAKYTDLFQEVVSTYLHGVAEKSPEFAARLALENKSIEQCCQFILQMVQKSGRAGFADDEIFGMAMHYYDEDDIEVAKTKVNAKVIVNRHVELTEEEKQKAHDEAMRDLIQEQKRLLSKPSQKVSHTAEKAKIVEMPSLF